MEWSFVFFLNSVLLGVGLAMDAFSVSMANGLHDPKMTKSTMVKIAGTFGIFQAAMPMIGWVCVHTIVELFASFETLIPWIALALLGYIGGKMLLEGIKGEEAEEEGRDGAQRLLIDALPVELPHAHGAGWDRRRRERVEERRSSKIRPHLMLPAVLPEQPPTNMSRTRIVWAKGGQRL